MTVIIGLEHDGKVYLGGDSYCGDGDAVDLCDTPKVFKIGPFGIGICGSIKCEQLFADAVELNIKNKKKFDRKWIQSTLTDIVRETMHSKGAFDKNERHMMPDDSMFLIAYDGQLYIFESDFSLWRSKRGYASIGAGSPYARGAMEALVKDKSLTPEEKVLRSLEAAENLSSFVNGPHTIIAV